MKDNFLRILWLSYAACWDWLHFTLVWVPKPRPGPPRLRWGPSQSPRIQPGVGADLVGIWTLVTTLSIRFLVVLGRWSLLGLLSLPTKAAATSP